MLDEVGELIGKAGALTLPKELSLHNKFKERFMQSDMPGSDIIALSRGSGRIKDTDKSLTEFSDELDHCTLFRAAKIVQVYVENDFESLCSKVSEALRCDWEIFAVEDLQLKKELVISLVENSATVKEQVTAVLQLWYDQEHMKTTSSDRLIKIVYNSSVCRDMVCNDCMELIREAHSDDRSDTEDAPTDDSYTDVPVDEKSFRMRDYENFLSNEEYIKLLETIGDFIGQTGASKLLQQFHMKPEDYSGIYGKGVLQELSKALHIGNEEEFLYDLMEKLNKACLLRAAKAVDESIRGHVRSEDNTLPDAPKLPCLCH